MDYLIRNASVVNEGEVFEADVCIDDGIISEIVPDAGHPNSGSGNPIPVAEADGAVIIDAKGKYLIPGIIDEQVRIPIHPAQLRADEYGSGIGSDRYRPSDVP